MSLSVTPTVHAVNLLRDRLAGRVVTARDADYDEARQLFYGSFARRPAAVVRPVDAAEVAKVVTVARDEGLPLVVRGGGHSIAGHSTTDGGIVLDLRNLDGLDIDPASHTAWAGGGVTAGRYTAAAGAHGLATGFGDTGTVGVAGITLGGGIGFLVRRHGLTIDNLLAAEVVTADGRVRHVDAAGEPDLFWGLRGGGGNLGVVTRLRFRLHPVGEVVGGMLLLPATPEVVHGVVQLAAAAPEALSMLVNVMLAPPMPFVPAEVHGMPVVLVMPVHTGPAHEAARDLADLRGGLAEAIVDTIAPMPYPQLFPPDDEGFPVAAMGIRSGYLDDLTLADAELITASLTAATAPMAVTQLRVLGGAVDRVAVGDTAYAHRGRGMMVNVATGYDDLDRSAEYTAWVTELAGQLYRDDAVYVNFLGDEGPDRVRAAYPGPTWDRLRAVKGRYDSDNLFRGNHNVPPASAR